MKFAHMADCHIGSWREPKLRDLSMNAFSRAIEISINEKVDFVLISGDLFNTAMPSFESLKGTVRILKDIKDNKIPVYIIPGSHDFSPSGKTMIDILEEAGLLTDVFKGRVKDKEMVLDFTIDKKTGAKITGIIGKRGMLEKAYYEALNRSVLEEEEGFKIFMLHTAITEFKPGDMEEMDSSPLSLLPKGFDYYAAGHVHYVFKKKQEGYGTIAYPGPLFPNNFRELEKLNSGGFYIFDNGNLLFKEVKVIDTFCICLDCSDMVPSQVDAALFDEIKEMNFKDTIVMIRLFGNLKSGRPSDIDIKSAFREIYGKSAFFVMRNMSKLSTPEFEEIKTEKKSIDDIESVIINGHSEKIKLDNLPKEKIINLTRSIMQSLNSEKMEGEKVYDFEKRIIDDAFRILGL